VCIQQLGQVDVWNHGALDYNELIRALTDAGISHTSRRATRHDVFHVREGQFIRKAILQLLTQVIGVTVATNVGTLDPSPSKPLCDVPNQRL